MPLPLQEVPGLISAAILVPSPLKTWALVNLEHIMTEGLPWMVVLPHPHRPSVSPFRQAGCHHADSEEPSASTVDRNRN